MPKTARKHFDDDIARAWALHALSAAETDPDLAADVARTAVAFGVGAMDAYLCDAFADTLARTLKICQRDKTDLPAAYAKLALPLGPLTKDYAVRANWGWRMAARQLMERDNLLQVSRLKELFNPSLPDGKKLWDDVAEDLIALNRIRMAAISKAAYVALRGKPKAKAKSKAHAEALRRIGTIVQRRHDIAHNCDRPRSAKKTMKIGSAQRMLRDVEDFVRILDEHLEAHRLY